jgi:hypothetical protein
MCSRSHSRLSSSSTCGTADQAWHRYPSFKPHFPFTLTHPRRYPREADHPAACLEDRQTAGQNLVRGKERLHLRRRPATGRSQACVSAHCTVDSGCPHSQSKPDRESRGWHPDQQVDTTEAVLSQSAAEEHFTGAGGAHRLSEGHSLEVSQCGLAASRPVPKPYANIRIRMNLRRATHVCPPPGVKFTHAALRHGRRPPRR